MGIFRRLFGSKKTRPLPSNVQHPVFGPIYMDTESSWFADSSDSIGCEGVPSVSIEGDDDGPFPGSVETYERLRSDWKSIAPVVAELLLELNHNYFSDEPSEQIHDPELLWESATLLAVCVGPDGDLSLTYTFNWQRPGDGHQITVYLKNWIPDGTSVDG